MAQGIWQLNPALAQELLKAPGGWSCRSPAPPESPLRKLRPPKLQTGTSQGVGSLLPSVLMPTARAHHTWWLLAWAAGTEGFCPKDGLVWFVYLNRLSGVNWTCFSCSSLAVPILLPDTGRGLGAEQHTDQATGREGCGWSSHWLFAGFVNEPK